MKRDAVARFKMTGTPDLKPDMRFDGVSRIDGMIAIRVKGIRKTSGGFSVGDAGYHPPFQP